MSSRRIQGWDPILIIAQIISLQSLHYLLLAMLLPPLLATFSTSPSYLEHQGGAATVTSVMDWREMAGRQTLPRGKGLGDWLEGVAWSGGKVVGGSGAANSGGGGKSGYEEKRGLSEKEAGLGEGLVRLGGEGGGAVWVMRAEEVFSSQARDWEWDGIVDPRRGWIIAGAWSIACVVDVGYLYQFVRRPTHILDHTLTLILSHLLLTTYYSHSLPTSLFWWVIVGGSTLAMVITAEQICVKREMMEDLGGDWTGNLEDGSGGAEEEGRLLGEDGEGRTGGGGSGKGKGREDIELGSIGEGSSRPS